MNDLIISLDTKAGAPLYEQICEYFKQEIQEGRLAAGMRLPSSRALAGNLSVSRSTVDLAYDQLVSEGYIEAVPCKGYFVCDIEGLYYGTGRREKTCETGRKAWSDNPQKGGSAGMGEERKAETDRAKYAYDFALNGIAPGSFPHNAWRKLSRQVLTDAQDALFALGDPCGELSLRQAVSAYLYQARGVHCEPEQILVGAGNDYLLMLLCTILGKDRKIAMENPTYRSAWHDFGHMGFERCIVNRDTQGIDVHDLEQTGADMVYVMPSHQFPMGTVMPLKRRLSLLKWAGRGDRYIIEDDYDSEFRYKGKPIPALQGFDKEERVIYLGTFSKSIAPSIRISYMVLPKKLMQRYLSGENPFSVTVSRADQKILELFLREGYYERHLNRMRSLYKGKHDLLLHWLKEGLGNVCTCSGENAGVHLLVHFKNGSSEQEAVERAAKAGVRVYGLSEFLVCGKAPQMPATVLLGYATMSEEDLEEGMKRLVKAWNGREKSY